MSVLRAAVLLVALAGLPACSREVPSVAVTPLAFGRQGVSFSISPALRLRRVDVFDESGILQLSVPFPGTEIAHLSLPLHWAPSQAYTVRLTDVAGRAWSRTGRAAAAGDATFALELDLPHGAGGAGAPFASRALATGTRAEGTIRLVSLAQGPQEVEVTVEHGGMAEAGGADLLRTRVLLRGMDDHWFTQVSILVPPVPARVSVTARVESSTRVVRLERTIVPADPSALSEQIELVSLELPTDSTGERDSRWQPDAIQLPGDTGFLRWLGGRVRPADPYEPFTWQAVAVRNRGEVPLPLLFRGRVLDALTGEPVAALSAPAVSSGGTGESLQIAECPPGTVTRVALPVFVHPSRVEEGRYRREVRVCLLGTDRAARTVERPLEVRRTGTFAWLSLGVSLLLTAVGVGILVRAGGGFWAGFRVRELVTIALYGSVSFAAVALPGSLLASVLSAVLGPLSAVVTGLVGRVLGYAVLASMLVLVPRPGAATLATTIKWLLSAVLFGQWNATACLYLGTYLTLLEAACALGGIRRWKRDAFLTRSRVALAAILIAAADAAATFVDFQVTALLYRVFFADWYLWLTVWLNGFVYSAVGVWLGFGLGREMRRVA